MSIKSSVAERRLQDLQLRHGSKTFRALQNVFLTGDQKPGSIGEMIRHSVFSEGHAVRSLVGDVRSEQSWYNHRNDLRETDTLILCHGVTCLQWFENIDMGKVREIMDVNLTSTFGLTQYFVQCTLEQMWRKRIVLIGSMAHRAVLNGSAAYCASKAGLAMLGRCLAWELAPKGYDVFVIHPSNTKGTPMTEDTITGLMRYQHLSRQQAESYWNDSPIRESILTTTDIAKLILFLMTPHSSYLSGAQLELAGGQR